MSKIEELKDDFVGMVDKAWHALEGTVDVDRARELVQEATKALKAQVEAVAEHLLYHVMDNATQPAAVATTPDGRGVVMGAPSIIGVPPEVSNPAVPSEPAAVPTETPAPPVETPAPEGAVPDPVESATGMAPPAGQPTSDAAPAETSAADDATEQASA